jgi:hypothetical protein
MEWFAARRRRKHEEALEQAGKTVRRLFPEPIAYVAQAWMGMVNHMLHVAPDIWNAKSLEIRILAFEGMSPALGELEDRFPIVREKIAAAAEQAGAYHDQARANILSGILAEALASVGEDRTRIYEAIFPAQA